MGAKSKHNLHSFLLWPVLLAAASNFLTACTPNGSPQAAQVEQRNANYKDPRQAFEKTDSGPGKSADPAVSSADTKKSKDGNDGTTAYVKTDGTVELPPGAVVVAKYDLPPSPETVSAPVVAEVTADSISLTAPPAPSQSSSPEIQQNAPASTNSSSPPSPAIPTSQPTQSAPLQIAVVEIPPVTSAEGDTSSIQVPAASDIPCSSSPVADGLKPSTDYAVAQCSGGVVVGSVATVTTLAQPVEVLSVTVEEDESKTVLGLTLPDDQPQAEVAVAVTSEAETKWVVPETGELVSSDEDVFFTVKEKKNSRHSAEVHLPVVPRGEFVMRVVTRNKKKMKTPRSLPVLARGHRRGNDDPLVARKIADGIVEAEEKAIKEKQQKEKEDRPVSGDKKTDDRGAGDSKKLEESKGTKDSKGKK